MARRPVWTLLDAMIGVAARLAWLAGGWKVQKRILALFLVQRVLNALRKPIIFGMH